MIYFTVDCESSGPCPGFGDLIEFAAVCSNGDTFKSKKFPPLCDNYDEGAYNALRITREEHLKYDGDVKQAFKDFDAFIRARTAGWRTTMWSDNPAYDWQWVNWGFCYSEAFNGNPFGHSARRIGDLYAGANGNIGDQRGWKRWRKTRHTHDPLDDARGAMEGLKAIKERFKL